MYSVRQCLCFLPLLNLAHALGHAAVGQQHELLHQFVGVFRLLEIAAYGLALVVYIKVELLTVKLHSAMLEPRRAQAFSQAVERYQLGGILALVSFRAGLRRGLASAVLHAVVLENLLHLLVAEPAVALDDGVDQTPRLYLGIVVHVEHRAVSQFLLVGTQRADEVAQAFGQHRYCAVDKIHARGPLLRLLVYNGALGHVVGYVGYVYANLPQVLSERAYREGIVKVLCVLWVYCKRRDVTEVLALLIVLLGDFGAYLVSSFLHTLRVLIRKAVLRQYRVHLNIVVALLTQHVGHLAYNILVVLRRPHHHLHQGLVAVLAALQLVLRYYYVVGKAATVGRQEGYVAFHTQRSHKRVAGTLKNLYYHRLLDVVLAAGHERHPHPVASKGEE